ncbi:DUF6177 family protein [Streptomyces griseoaurantiacus]|uniref:DUF6177 family protein n=1 Tax=Streptomyces griseoaurantiacus TaxID=68213 RepID=UPI0035ABF1E5
MATSAQPDTGATACGPVTASNNGKSLVTAAPPACLACCSASARFTGPMPTWSSAVPWKPPGRPRPAKHPPAGAPGPANLPWSRRRLTDLAYERAPAPTWTTVVGSAGRPSPPCAYRARRRGWRRTSRSPSDSARARSHRWRLSRISPPSSPRGTTSAPSSRN